MNLFDMLANAQGGNGIEALARQFGLSQQQAQSAVEALMPAFSQGLKQNAADPYGFGSFLSALSSGQHAQYFDNAASAFSPQGMAQGNGILGHLFGSKDLSRAVAAQASQATGIGQDILKQMLPAIATMLMGGLFRQTNNQMAASGFGGSGNPLGELIEQMMRQGGGGQAQPRRQETSNTENPFGKMLEGMLGGGQARQSPSGGDSPLGPLGDILGQVLGGGQASPQRRAPQGGSGNPLEDILGQILGGGRSAQEEPQEQPRSRPSQRSSNPLEDIFGKMMEPGRQMGDQYQKGVSDIFDQFRRNMDRHR